MVAAKKKKIFLGFRSLLNDKSTKKKLFVASALVLPIIGFSIFWVYIHIDSFLMAFQVKSTKFVGRGEFSLDNYKRVFDEFFTNGLIPISLRNTLIFFFSGQLITFPIAILTSYFVFKKVKGYRVFRTVSYLPTIITSSALVALYRQSVVGNGPLSNLCNLFGITYVNPFDGSNPRAALIAIVVYTVLFGIGGNIIVLCGAMNSIDKQVIESAELDGCSWFRELFSVVIPAIWPTISTIIILNFVSILGASGPILAFTKGGNNVALVNATSTLSFLMYAYTAGLPFLGNIQDMYYASTIGLIMTLMTFPIVLILRRFIFKEEK